MLRDKSMINVKPKCVVCKKTMKSFSNSLISNLWNSKLIERDLVFLKVNIIFFFTNIFKFIEVFKTVLRDLSYLFVNIIYTIKI